ncbi:tetratricopeptide repeat protein [Candidatus Puniceispirillum marinum]|uniref:TPR repeat protein n=1 Tax=Puniceispirillum marinum (strain IMCC1322) TaxID=488538 RepID=D5BTF2_PUNMI|nr:tetratricopeptide repeat-containing sulfotransferase family protein [Candidatus Puniceispirillum marinum]ADE39549.1 TPR repeat protein [Candidatus Puniceispirillum marinum IMCC1322]
MELTIQQALQHGVAAHNQGNLQKAERIYQAILQSQPKHPDANHNLGLIAIAMGKSETALQLFQKALDVNPKVEQFWLSYVDALIKNNQIKDAKRAIKKAKKIGFDSQKLEALSLSPKLPVAGKTPPQAQLDSLLKCYQAGQYGDAEKQALSLTKTFPRHQFGWKVLGAILGQTNRNAEALTAIQMTVTLSPKDAEAHCNLGVILQKLVRLDEAEASYKQAIALQPDYAEAHGNLAATLQECGRLSEAEASYKQAIALQPDYAKAHFNLASTLHDLGRLDEAEVSYMQVIALIPTFTDAHINLGITRQSLAKLDAAEANFKHAIVLQPDYAKAHFNLASTLHDLGRLDEAEASYEQAIALQPDYAKAHFNLAGTRRELGRLDEAEASYNDAIALQPGYVAAHANLGLMLQELGRLDVAEARYNDAIALQPGYAKAYHYLTTMKKFLTKDDQYSKLQELYRDEKMPEEQRCHINFALAKASEDLEDFEQAFTHYCEGNALRKKFLNYNISQDVELFSQLQSSYPKIEKNALDIGNLAHQPTPVFIVGMPRSGTTLVEQIISSHSNVTGAGELSFVAQYGGFIARGATSISTDAIHKFREQYLSKLQNLSNGNLMVTDKMPQNFRYIGLLAAAFPEAKIVHVKRNPAAVCWANYKQYFKSNGLGYCYDLGDVVRYHKLYESLMAFWDTALGKRIYTLDYERLTVNQTDETHKLITYLDLDWDEKCLSPQNNRRRVTTASNVQVRDKVYQGSSQQWKHYKPFLKGLFDGLDD